MLFFINTSCNIDLIFLIKFQLDFLDFECDSLGNWKPDTWQSSGVRPMFIVNKVNGAAATRTQSVTTRFILNGPAYPIQKATRMARITK